MTLNLVKPEFQGLAHQQLKDRVNKESPDVGE